MDPEVIRSAMVKNGHKFKRPDLVAKVVPSTSKGLFSANGKAHSRQKRMIGPAFNTANLRGFLEVFQENTEKLVQVNKCKLCMKIRYFYNFFFTIIIGELL